MATNTKWRDIVLLISMDAKITTQSHPTEKKQRINRTTHTVFPRNKGCDGHEFTGALIDFQLSGRFLSLSRSKKVNEFLRVANIWNSGYSMGETIVISVKLHDHDEFLSYLVKDTRRIYSKNKFNEKIKYGNLTLKIEIRDDGRGRYSVSETRKKGAPSYREVLEAALESRKQLLKSKEVRRKFEIHRIVTEDAISYVIARLGISVDYKNIFDRKPVYEEVTFENYYVSTDVDYKSITTNDNETEISEIWARMKDSEKYRYHHSPMSCSQYLENRENGVIYRFSDHWGACASCYWTLDGEAGMVIAIGQAELGDFQKRTPMEWVRLINDEGIRSALKENAEDIQKIELLLNNYEFQGNARQSFERLHLLFNIVNDAMNSRDISMIIEACSAVNDYIRSF